MITYTLHQSGFSDKVYLFIAVRQYGSFGAQSLSIKLISYLQCFTSVNEASSCLLDEWSLSTFGIQGIASKKVAFGHSGKLPLTFMSMHSPISAASGLLPGIAIFLASWTTLARFFQYIPTQCHRIHSELSNISTASQILNVSKTSGTTFFHYRGPSRSCSKWLCQQRMDQCFHSQNPATHCFLHLLQVLKLDCPIHLANCFKENSVCYRLIGALSSVPPMSNKLSFLSSASYLSLDILGTGGNSGIPATYVRRDSAVHGNCGFGRCFGNLTGAPDSCPDGWKMRVEWWHCF